MEEDNEKGIQDYIDVLKRHKNKMLLIALIAFILTVFLALRWPATYKSTAIILIEQQEIPQELVRSTVTSYADQRIQVISQRVMSSVHLKKIINKFDLYLEEKKTDPISVVLEEMRDNIHLEMVSADVVDPRSGRPTLATIAFMLSFEDENPQKAQKVANELVNLYLNENLKRRSEIASEATNFLAIEAGKLSELVSSLEEKLAKFKEKNEQSLPELQQLNMSLMDRTEQQLLETNRQLASASDRIVYLNAEISQLDPNMSAFSATGERIYGSSDRLKSLQAQYVGLQARYASNHPDVVKMKKEISALEDEVGGVDKLEIGKQLQAKRSEMAAISKRYSSDHPDVKKLKKQISNLITSIGTATKPKKSVSAKPDNPAYIQLLAQLNAAKAEKQAMTTVKNKLLNKLEKYETGLLKAPQVEREYLQLTREHTNAVLKFREVKDKQMEADIAQAMEKDRKAERFSLIEPPLMPDEPFKPNRPLIIFLGLIFSLGISLAYAFIKDALSSAIYGTRGLMSSIGEQPLVVIPFINNVEDIQKAKNTKRKTLYFSLAAVILTLTVFHFFIMPLDVFWYVLFRKLGIS